MRTGKWGQKGGEGLGDVKVQSPRGPCTIDQPAPFMFGMMQRALLNVL